MLFRYLAARFDGQAGHIGKRGVDCSRQGAGGICQLGRAECDASLALCALNIYLVAVAADLQTAAVGADYTDHFGDIHFASVLSVKTHFPLASAELLGISAEAGMLLCVLHADGYLVCNSIRNILGFQDFHLGGGKICKLLVYQRIAAARDGDGLLLELAARSEVHRHAVLCRLVVILRNDIEELRSVVFNGNSVGCILIALAVFGGGFARLVAREGDIIDKVVDVQRVAAVLI